MQLFKRDRSVPRCHVLHGWDPKNNSQNIIEMASEYPECEMLDALTGNQRFFMFSMAAPSFQSKIAQHMDASSFGHPLKTLPMVHGSEQGLGESTVEFPSNARKPQLCRPAS